MSIFRVSVVAANVKDDQMTTAPIEVLVDTGSWQPCSSVRGNCDHCGNRSTREM